MDSAPAVDRDAVEAVLGHFWPGSTITELIKPSQNYTYSGSNKLGERIIIRAVPNGEQSLSRVQLEADLLAYIRQEAPALQTTSMVPTKDGELVAKGWTLPDTSTKTEKATDGSSDKEEGDQKAQSTAFDIALVVMPFADGAAVDVMQWKWMSDEPIVTAVARWIGRFHAVSKKLPADLQSRVRGWRELHDSVLDKAPVDPADEVVASDPEHFGVLHGDINCSNYFLLQQETSGDDASKPVVDIFAFDWDQVQRGWFLYDLAQVIWGAIMLQWGGWMDGSAVPVQNVDEFIRWSVAGYEEGSGATVDMARLFRMIALRREFYITFARRELSDPKLPAGMHGFCEYIVKSHESTQERFDAFMKQNSK